MFHLTNRGSLESKAYPAVIFIIVLSLIVDMVFDIRDGIPVSHLWHEGILILLCLSVLLLQSLSLKRQREELAVSAEKIRQGEIERAEFQKKIQHVSKDFSQVVEEEFQRWNLTEGERDVAILLVKGMSMKEIAETRHTSEATVRQQAASIYRKSGQEGRSRLTAYFLEDLFSLKG